jgi:hypothetical protein
MPYFSVVALAHVVRPRVVVVPVPVRTEGALHVPQARTCVALGAPLLGDEGHYCITHYLPTSPSSPSSIDAKSQVKLGHISIIHCRLALILTK